MKATSQADTKFEMKLEVKLKHVLGDPNALSTVLLNLFNNSIDAMPDGGTLTVTTRNMQTGEVEILVEDTGIGMSSDVVAKAVEPFFTTKPEGSGTGLGLSQAFRIVQAHRGTLNFSSNPGIGTQVRLVFPVAVQPFLELEALKTATPILIGAELDVLIVDDDELVLDAAVETFRALGHKVTSASGGDEALSRLKTFAAPDIVVLDLNMPGMNGEQILIRLRQSFPSLPVLLSSGRTDEKALSLVETFSHVGLLPKPYSIDDVRRTLDKLVPELLRIKAN